MKNIGLIFTVAGLFLLLNYGPAHAYTGDKVKIHEIAGAANAGDYATADTLANQLVVEDPINPVNHWVYANVLIREGKDLVRARKELELAKREAPGLPFVNAQYANVMSNQLTNEEAEATRESAQHVADVHRLNVILLVGLVGLIIVGFIVFLLIARKLSRDEIKRRFYPSTPSSGGDVPPHHYNDNYSSPSSVTSRSSASRVIVEPSPYVPPYYTNTNSSDGLLTGVLIGESMSRNSGNNTTIIEEPQQPAYTPGPSSSVDSSPPDSGSTDFGTSTDNSAPSTDFGIDNSVSDSNDSSSSGSDFGMDSSSSDSSSSSDFGTDSSSSDSGSSGGDFGMDSSSN